MIWIAGVLAVFLFYKFVKSEHKIIFFKFLAALILIIGLGFCMKCCFDYWKSNKDNGDVTVESFERYNILPLALLNDLSAEYDKNIKNYNYDYEASKERSQVLKNRLLSKYFNIKLDDYFHVEWTEDEIYTEVILSSNDANENDISKLHILEEKRIDRYLKGLDLKKVNNNSATSNLLFGGYVYTVINTFSSYSQKVFIKKLSKEDNQLYEEYISVQDKINDLSNNIINNYPNISLDISFNICNKKDKKLNSVKFLVDGYVSDRSTSYGLLDNYSTSFDSDIIIKPKSCSLITWYGKYKYFYKYIVKDIYGVWNQ